MLEYLKNQYAYHFRLNTVGKLMAEKIELSYWEYWKLCKLYKHNEWVDLEVPEDGDYLPLYSEEDILEYVRDLEVDKNHLV